MLAQTDVSAVDEVFSAERASTDPSTPNPGRGARLTARLRAGRLDRALARGADPAGSGALAARAARLDEPRSRAALADQLDGLLQSAQHPRGHSRIPPQRTSVMANADALGQLADLLREPKPLYVSGSATLNHLLRDATGPAYVGNPHELTARLGEADDLLRHGARPIRSGRHS